MADFGLSAVLGLVGTAVSAAGTLAAGAAQKSAADFQAAQLKQQAQEETAAAQREAERAKKEKDFVISRQQAVAGASGLGALDETVQSLAGDVITQGEVNKGMILYGGEERAKGRRAQAVAAQMEGKAAQTGSYFGAAGTLMDGIGSFAKDWKQPAYAAPSSGNYY